MKTSRRIFKNIFSLTVAEMANKGLAFLLMAYLARVIEPSGMGIFGYSTSIIAYFTLIVSQGFDQIGQREIAKPEADLPKFVNHLTTIRFAFALIGYLILAAMVYFLDKPPMIKYAVLIQGLNLFATAFYFSWVYIGLERMEVLAVRQIAVGILNFLGIVLLVNDYSDTVLAISIMVFTLIINSTWMVLYYIKAYHPFRFQFDLKFWKKLIKNSFPIGLSFFIVAIYNNFNITLLGEWRTEDETGFYFSAYKVLVLSILPSTIIQSSLFPMLSRSFGRESRQDIMNKYTKILYFSGTFISVCLFVFAEPVISIVFGSDYMESAVILRILSVTTILMFMTVSYSAPLIAWNMEKKVMYAVACGGIVNVIFNLSTIKTYGIFGAAYSTIASELTVFTALIFIFAKVQGGIYISNLIKFGLLSLISGAAGYIMLQYGIHYIPAFIVTFIVYITVIFAGGMIKINELKGYLKK